MSILILRSAAGAGSGGGGGESLPLIFQDDFSSGDLSHTENGISWSSGGNVAVTNQNGGVNALKFTFPAGFAGPEQRIDLGAARTEYVFTYDLYFPNGAESYGGAAYTHRANSPSNNKFFRLWRGNKSDGQGNDGYGSFYSKLGSSLEREMTGIKISGLQNEHGVNNTGMGPEGEATGINGGYDDDFVSTSDLGAYTSFRGRYKSATAAGNDGIIEAWKNGVKVASQNALPIYPSGGAAFNGFDFCYFFGAPNSGQDATYYIFMRNLKIYGA